VAQGGLGWAVKASWFGRHRLERRHYRDCRAVARAMWASSTARIESRLSVTDSFSFFVALDHPHSHYPHEHRIVIQALSIPFR